MKISENSQVRAKRAARLNVILAAVRENSGVRLNELARELGVSTETIRRDMERLSQEGLIKRTYGGAVAPMLGVDPSLNERLEISGHNASLLAPVAASLVRPGEVLCLSSGVMSLRFAQCLASSAGQLTVITTSLSVASVLGRNPEIRVILAPGDYDPSEQAVFGPETQQFLLRFRTDSAFFGASGLTGEGPSESRSSVAWNLRAMLKKTSRNVLIIDSDKVGRSHLEQIVPLENIHVIVTDKPLPRHLAEALARAGGQVLLVPASASA